MTNTSSLENQLHASLISESVMQMLRDTHGVPKEYRQKTVPSPVDPHTPPRTWFNWELENGLRRLTIVPSAESKKSKADVDAEKKWLNTVKNLKLQPLCVLMEGESPTRFEHVGEASMLYLAHPDDPDSYADLADDLRFISMPDSIIHCDWLSLRWMNQRSLPSDSFTYIPNPKFWQAYARGFQVWEKNNRNSAEQDVFAWHTLWADFKHPFILHTGNTQRENQTFYCTTVPYLCFDFDSQTQQVHNSWCQVDSDAQGLFAADPNPFEPHVTLPWAQAWTTASNRRQQVQHQHAAGITADERFGFYLTAMLPSETVEKNIGSLYMTVKPDGGVTIIIRLDLPNTLGDAEASLFGINSSQEEELATGKFIPFTPSSSTFLDFLLKLTVSESGKPNFSHFKLKLKGQNEYEFTIKIGAKF